MDNKKPYRIEIVRRQDILSYKVSGYIKTEDDFHRFIREADLIIKHSKFRKVLSDQRTLKGLRPGILDAVKVVEEDLSPELWRKKIAVIECIENTNNMKYREIVALNHGFTLRYFTSPEEAEAWLQ